MKKALVAVLAVVLLAAGFAAGRLVPAGSGGASGRKILHWVDPMHPAYTSDKPGIAPDCGMQLEPVYADGGPAAAPAEVRPAGSVSLDPGLRQLQGVKVGAVQKVASTRTLRLFGRVVPDETRLYALNASLDGSIKELSPEATTGALVRKGQRLGRFFAADTRTPMQALITALDVQALDPTAQANQGVIVGAGSHALRNVEFSIERLRGMGMSDQQIEQMRKERLIPVTIDIVSPADGLVMARNVTTGQKYGVGTEWFRIANLDRVWVVADVAEADAAQVKPGAKVDVTVPGLSRRYAAVVSRVPPQFDQASRTLKVRLELDNPGLMLRPEMFVDVEVAVERPAAITVLADAIVDSGLRKTVFVERGDGWYEPRRVETGWRDGDRVEIVKGLEAGEKIVVAGTFLVDSESQLKAAAAGVYGEPVKDPVCGMEVDQAKAKAAGKTLVHQGSTYYFCSKQCQHKFEDEPSKYAEPGHAHGDEKLTKL